MEVYVRKKFLFFCYFSFFVIFLFGCSSPKFNHAINQRQALNLTLPDGFLEVDKEDVEQQLRPLLTSWPTGTTISVSIQPLALDPRSTLKNTWSEAIGNSSETGWNTGSAIGEIVDILLLRVPLYRVTLGATGFIVGGVGGTLVGPLVHGYERLDSWNSREFNFIAGVRIETPGKPLKNVLFFDKEHYPVKFQDNGADRAKHRKESLVMFSSELAKHLRSNM